MASENSVQPATEEIRLLLIGPPKTGKSSIANILAGCNVFPVGASSSVESATPTTQSRHFTNKKILPGKHLLVVDAPPLFILKDATSNDKDMRRLAKCVALVSPGPHAIFLILSCDDAKNERFNMKQIVTTVFGAEALNHSIVVFSFIDRLERKGISVDDWINKECKQQALLEACGHRYLVIDSSHNDQTKHIDFLNRSLAMLNELWKRQQMFKSTMFDDIEQEIQRQEKNRWDLFQKKHANDFYGSEKALRLLLREHMRDELEREPILAEADYLVVEKYLQPIVKSLLQEVERYLEEEIVST
ncbi:unnamed protein product [Rotaria sp. Silwood1]|nr:unnamed protein product [Rotaria sp. Silwood1]CAF0748349.1 unnamed protein product [Rotaria sp. Silwood1]CAF0804995.1 unnamed protein product [Rotaria sp. Silwood1]CAF3335830.1 unnamed protein product [Rotaria sp. Silwood1]CAF3356483.1 unnamed protein product [Rotaria sp. Silwood1]